MWLIAEYEAVTLFSLKLSTATSSGGKTLLVPTPYALKMALLGVVFHLLRRLDVADDAFLALGKPFLQRFATKAVQHVGKQREVEQACGEWRVHLRRTKQQRRRLAG